MTNQEIIKEIKQRLTDKLKLVGELVQSEAKKNITEMDAVDSSRLLNSIDYEIDDDTVRIGSNVEYAPYVELGTYKMKPRPYLRNAVYQNLNEIKEILHK